VYSVRRKSCSACSLLKRAVCSALSPSKAPRTVTRIVLMVVLSIDGRVLRSGGRKSGGFLVQELLYAPQAHGQQ
jgi:hypothetical protein